MLANRSIAGKTCPVCGQEIGLGEPIRNCELCFTPHHEPCWTTHGGCGTAGCKNAPPPAIKKPAAAETPPPPPPVAGAPPQPPPIIGPDGTVVPPLNPPASAPAASAAAPPPPPQQQRGKKPCPQCGEMIQAAARKCRFCGSYIDRPAAGPVGAVTVVRRSGLAVASLACGIASIVICFFGFFIGPVAIGLGIGARNEIARSDGRLSGGDMAKAGLVTGAIGTVVSVILMIIGMVAE
jgi:hypothetical protein